MPAVGSSRKRRVGSWTSALGELESSLHPARQPAGPRSADLPEVHELEDLARAAAAGTPEHAEQRRDEVDVLPRREVGIQREGLGHVADPLPRPTARSGSGSSPRTRTVAVVGESAPVSIRTVVVLPEPDGPDRGRGSIPAGTVEADAVDGTGRRRSGVAASATRTAGSGEWPGRDGIGQGFLLIRSASSFGTVAGRATSIEAHGRGGARGHATRIAIGMPRTVHVAR